MRHRVFWPSTLDPRLLTLLWSFLSFSSFAPLRADDKSNDSVPKLLEVLKSDQVANRRDAALVICRLDLAAKKEALPGLIDRIANDKDPQTRLAVLDALFDLGPEAASAVPVLVNAIKNDFGGQFAEEQYGRLRVAWTLGSIGVEAVEPLRPVLAEKKSRTRLAAALVMGRIGPPAVAATPELITLLGDSDVDVRKEAIRSLGRIGTGAEKELLAALESSSPQAPSPQTRAGIIASLGSSDKPGEQARAAIAAGTRDESPLVRASALKAAAAQRFPLETLVPILIESLAHEDADLRLAAINVVVPDRSLLWQIRPRLGGLLMAENEGVSRHAAYLLQTIGMEAAPEMIAALRDERTRVEQLAEALAGIGSRVTASLVTALHDENPRVRRGAALALGRVRPVAAESVEHLTASLSDPAPQVQVAALESLGQLGPQARQSLDQLQTMLHKESADTRIQTIEALFRIHPHDELLLNLFVALLNDAESRVQQRAIETIRRLGPLARKSLPAVVERLRSPSSEVRLAAGALVGSLGRAAGDAVPSLTPLLVDGDANLRAIAAEALGQIGAAAQPALADLVRLLDDQEVKVRAAATQALGGLELEPEVIRPHVAKSLGDGESDVRNAAIAAIQKYRRRGSIFLPDLIRLAGKEPDQRYLRDALRRFERSGPDSKSIPELLALLDGQPDAARLKAIEFLGLAGSDATDAIPRLEAFGQDPNEEIKKRAHTAIERIKSGKRGTGEN